MASELHISERVYRAVKAELLGLGFAPGEKIEAVQLARRHIASITPVRAALHRLTGEGLVDARAGEGFHAPQVTEASLRDLYAWNAQILQLAWQISVRAEVPDVGSLPGAETAAPLDGTAAATANLFTAIGESSENEQCILAINHLNDQLLPARSIEAEAVAGINGELRELAEVIGRGQSTEVRHAITAYHRRRIKLAADLVRLMHRRRR